MNLGLQMSVKRNTRQASMDLHNWISLTCWYQNSHNQIRAVSKVNGIRRCETHTPSPPSSKGPRKLCFSTLWTCLHCPGISSILGTLLPTGLNPHQASPGLSESALAFLHCLLRSCRSHTAKTHRKFLQIARVSSQPLDHSSGC